MTKFYNTKMGAVKELTFEIFVKNLEIFTNDLGFFDSIKL